MHIYKPVATSPAEFVAFWGPQYFDEHEYRYTDNIGKLEKGAIEKLFQWKAGPRYRERTRTLVRRKYLPLLSKISRLPSSHDPAEFLKLTGTGAIWGIFLLHCWQQEKYPIYDQNVHRAMAFITKREREEIQTWSDKRKIDAYLNVYLPFFGTFRDCDLRLTDRALFMFGKFLKTSMFPDIVAWRQTRDP